MLPLALLFLLLIPLKDERPDAAEDTYEHAVRIFHQGFNAEAHQEAAAGWARYQESEPELAGKFRLLDAQTLIYLGSNEAGSEYGKQALDVLSKYSPPHKDALSGQVEKLTYQASAWIQQMELYPANMRTANQELDDAEELCSKAQPQPDVCGGMWLGRGSLAYNLRHKDRAQMFYLRALDFARAHKDTWRQANALMQLGYVAFQAEQFDESVQWSRTGNEMAARHGYDDLKQLTAGNLGDAWWKLGDTDRALEWLETAEKIAAGLGDLSSQQFWVTQEALVYRDRGTLNYDHEEVLHAEELDERILAIARQLRKPQGIVDALLNVALLEIYTDTDKLDKADAHLREAQQIEAEEKHAPSSYLTLVEGELATAKHDFAKGEENYRSILANTSNPIADRLNAGNSLGRLYEAEGKFALAERTYKNAIAEWIAARAQLKHEDSALSFTTTASHVYKNYVRFLVKRGRTAEALAQADQIRARTLAAGLGMDAKHPEGKEEALRAEQIARKTDATLFFYWLDKTASYLWVVTPQKSAVFTLPGESEIAGHVESYRRAIIDLHDPIETANADGVFLYHTLVEPARGMVDAKKPVIVLADGALNELNFETLPVPESARKAHALIEDWTLESAPSLDLLAHGENAKAAGAQKMLLVGNPVMEDPKFPPLRYFGTEMKRVAGHFDAASVDVISDAKATPAAYVNANPERFEFIHFVSHATANRTNPLDSAILLSQPDGKQVVTAAQAEDAAGAYKLYAREILTHPLNARLVTISACDGAGTRAYVGEGPIGLSWAFLRAGARQVVAALWEVSDDSTPKLMDTLYAGIAAGKTPAEALREAKLELLHAKGKLRQPFYWAAFQIYSR